MASGGMQVRCSAKEAQLEMGLLYMECKSLPDRKSVV